MRSRLRTGLTVFVVMSALAALASSSALATLPVFSAGIAGKTGASTSFTLKGGTAELIPEDTTFTCTTSVGSGEITGEKSGIAKISLRGCKKLPLSTCTSAGAVSGEVISNTVPFTLVYTEKEPTKQVAIDLNSSRGTFATFVCGGVKVVVRNSILVPVAPLNTTTKSFTMEFKVSTVSLEQEPRKNYKENLMGTEASFPEASWAGETFNEAFGLQAVEKLENMIKAGVEMAGKIEA